MITKTIKSILLFFLLLSVNQVTAQEVAPLKTFHFDISLNKLKTEAQAQAIEVAVSKISGVQNCELILTNYTITFNCSNHDMTRNQVMDKVKVAIVSNGSEIVKIQRKEEDEK